MSNPNPPEDKNQDALAALHGLEDEAEQGEEGESADKPAEDVGASTAASGFVGTLAKDGPGQSAAPVPAGGATPEESGEISLRPRRDEIQMAREIRPVGLTVPARGNSSRKGPKTVPGWYHVAVPLMFTLGAILFLIGAWAVGAMIYMKWVNPNPELAKDAVYPLIDWIPDDTGETPGAYSSASRIMALAMLVCLPLSIAMSIMSGLMQKQIRLANRSAGK